MHRPLRSLISITAVAIEVIMILSIVGIFMGMLNDNKQRTNGIGADLMMRPSNASMLSMAWVARDDDQDRRLLARTAPCHCCVTGQCSISRWALPSRIIYGIDYDSFDALRHFQFVAGGKFQGPYDVIIDDVFARSRKGGYHLGDNIEIFNHDFRICGIVEAWQGRSQVAPIDTMGDLTGTAGKASVFYLKLDDPATTRRSSTRSITPTVSGTIPSGPWRMAFHDDS